MTKIRVDVVNTSSNELPEYATVGSAGLDLRASFTNIDLASPKPFIGFGYSVDSDNMHIILVPGGRIIVPTDLFVAIPEGYEIQVRPRSGLAIKNGITCLNTPGTIDSKQLN